MRRTKFILSPVIACFMVLAAMPASARGPSIGAHGGADVSPEMIAPGVRMPISAPRTVHSCLRKHYMAVIKLGGSRDEALGTACGLCHVSC